MFPARIALLVPTVIALATLVACSPTPSPSSVKTVGKSSPSQYEVQLDGEWSQPGSTGDPKVKFDGECLVTASDISSASRMVEGTTPKTITYSGQSISCSFQKKEADIWHLKATVKKDGIKVKEVSTESRYGVVSFVV